MSQLPGLRFLSNLTVPIQELVLPDVVANGAKIMSLTVPHCKIKMIDSINFLPMALAKLPQMFGFTELKKGYFPHLFNTKENQSVMMYTLPDISYYTPDSMISLTTLLTA